MVCPLLSVLEELFFLLNFVYRFTKLASGDIINARKRGGIAMDSIGEKVKIAAQRGDIWPYPEELLEKLSHYTFSGIPLSVLLSSTYLTKRWCHHYAFLITRGMEHFQIIRGHLDVIEDEEFLNHSWVQLDNNTVYDTTDGFCYLHGAYQEIYQPIPIEIYDEKNYSSFPLYGNLESQLDQYVEPILVETFLQAVESIEKEKPSINCPIVLAEIQIFRMKSALSPENLIVCQKEVERMKRKILQN